MKCIYILLAFISAVCCIEYNGLRVKFGWSDALAGTQYFFSIPRTIIEAVNAEWERTERPPGPMPELRMYCPGGRGVCALYDTAGFVAGIMIALPIYELDSPVIKPEKIFVKWVPPPMVGSPSIEYWTATQYYVSEESLKAGAGPQVENGYTLQDGGVWVPDLDGRLMRIPSTEAELNSTAFKKQNCFPNMGTHYYYNMTKNLKCDNLLPWFALTTEGELVGTGFQIIGKLVRQKTQEWIERQFTGAIGSIIPSAPQCLLDMEKKFDVLSIHIYYVDNPWHIVCRTGDSIQPVPIIDRLLLNGFRHFNRVSDELVKLFNG